MATEKTPKTQEYNDDSIRSLKGADRVRKRPAVIFGSDGLDGCEHSFFEILANAVDEAKEGHGDVIRVTSFLDRSIEVDDRGRGVPLGWNEKEQRYNWDLIFCEMYAGGKYDNNTEGSTAYKFSLGLNGLGACATQCSSEYMDVYSYNGTVERSIHFKQGNPVTELAERELARGEKRTGTVIRWKPDLEVFKSIDIPAEFFEETIHRQAFINPHVRFVLRTETETGKFEEKEYYYENGISDYIRERVPSPMTEPVLWHMDARGRDREDLNDYDVSADISFCISNTDPLLEYYHNSSFLEYGGSPDKAARTAFTNAVDKYLKNAGKYNKTEAKITFTDIADCLSLVINSQSTETSYENQTKKAIRNAFIYEALADFLKKNLDIFFVEHPTEAEVFANQVLINKRSRETAERSRIEIKKKLTGTIDIANRVEKFVSCRSKDPNLRELYIVEGDSACSSCKLGRSAEFQAIMPVRGKTLNCLKVDYARIFQSQIITDLLRVIGCGVEITGKVKGDIPTFDLNSLRWSKIILCTDADEDGFQIRTLLLTLFYRLLPTLIRENRIFIAESPLFEITTKDETLFAYDEFEKAEILKKLEGKRYTLQRSKGLGENQPDMMWQTTMNPATRRLVSIRPADAAATDRIFETLLGNDLPARKEFITLHGSEYVKEADF